MKDKRKSLIAVRPKTIAIKAHKNGNKPLISCPSIIQNIRRKHNE